jgi:hypothetical protein
MEVSGNEIGQSGGSKISELQDFEFAQEMTQYVVESPQ